MGKIISDVHIELAYRLGESAVPNSAIELARRLNWFKTAINKACAGEQLMWFMLTKATDITIADQSDYSVPSDFRQMEQLKVDGYKYKEIPFDEVYQKYEVPSSPVPILPSFMDRAYYYRFDKLYLIPIPSSAPTTFTASSITTTVLTATATTTVAHGYVRGDVVTISGSTSALYDGEFTILTVPSTTTFTFTVASALGPATAGSIVKNNIEIIYYKKPTEPTAVGSSIVLPDEFIDLIVAYAEGRYWSYAHKRAKAADAFTEFESRLQDLRRENFRKKFYAT